VQYFGNEEDEDVFLLSRQWCEDVVALGTQTSVVPTPGWSRWRLKITNLGASRGQIRLLWAYSPSSTVAGYIVRNTPYFWKPGELDCTYLGCILYDWFAVLDKVWVMLGEW
jgi:hypothetical protein